MLFRSITKLALDEHGHVADTLTRTFSRTPDGHAVIDLVGDGRRVTSLGGLKITRSDTAKRELKVDLVADRGVLTQRVDLQGQEMGQLVTHKDADTVTVQWKAGPLDSITAL